MVDITISEMTAAGTLTGEELVEISQLSTSVTITGTTISAQASDNSFNDSGSGFVSAGFAAGDRIHVTGFTGNVANNLFTGIIDTIAAGKITILGAPGAAIVDDAAGESVTITKWVSRRKDVADLGGGGGSGERARVVPVGADFTLENPGTASNADVTSGVKLIVPNVAAQIRFLRYTAGPPATPYSVVVRSDPISITHGAGLYKRALIARNSSNGRIIIYSDYNSVQHLVQQWSSYSGFAGGPYGPTSPSELAKLPWMRMRNDGTNLYFGLSPDGYDDTFYEFHTEPLANYLTAAGGTCDQVGVGTMMDNFGSTAESVFQSFEIVV